MRHIVRVTFGLWDSSNFGQRYVAHCSGQSFVKGIQQAMHAGQLSVKITEHTVQAEL